MRCLKQEQRETLHSLALNGQSKALALMGQPFYALDRSMNDDTMIDALVARDLVTADPLTIEADATVGDALDMLWSLDVRHLPVVRGGKVVGMLSDRDVNPFAA